MPGATASRPELLLSSSSLHCSYCCMTDLLSRLEHCARSAEAAVPAEALFKVSPTHRQVLHSLHSIFFCHLWACHSLMDPGTQQPAPPVQDELLRLWCRSVLRGFSNCVGGYPQLKLQGMVDKQLRLPSLGDCRSSWAQLFGNLTAPNALASEGGLATQQQLQVQKLIQHMRSSSFATSRNEAPAPGQPSAAAASCHPVLQRGCCWV